VKSLEVYVEQAKEALEKILKLEHISEFTVVCRRPNSDTLHDLEEQLEDSMNEQHAREYDQTWKADRSGEGFRPNKKTIQYAKTSLSYGFTRAIGTDKGDTKQKPHSTESIPLRETIITVPEEETTVNALQRIRPRVLKQISSTEEK